MQYVISYYYFILLVTSFSSFVYTLGGVEHTVVCSKSKFPSRSDSRSFFRLPMSLVNMYRRNYKGDELIEPSLSHINIFEDWENANPGQKYRYGKLCELIRITYTLGEVCDKQIWIAKVVVYSKWTQTTNALSGNGYCQTGERIVRGKSQIALESFDFVFLEHVCDQVFLIKDDTKMNEPHLYLVVEGYDLHRRHFNFNSN